MRPLALALVHAPVRDRTGQVIASAVTNLDLHDLARIGRTYGVGRVYVVTPVAEQQRLVRRIVAHWREGFGARSNPDRAEAFGLLALAADLDAALADWQECCGEPVRPLLTGAGLDSGISFEGARQRLHEQPLLLVLGTAWGLAPELFDRGWEALAPIRGAGPYNHLPVRAAAAIMLDRLLGSR